MRTRTAFHRLAAGMAFVIGAMAVFAGGQVLLGQLPDYYVIDWLPIYNLTLGLVSALFASVVIWRNSRLALPTATPIFGLHAVVMLDPADGLSPGRGRRQPPGNDHPAGRLDDHPDPAPGSAASTSMTPRMRDPLRLEAPGSLSPIRSGSLGAWSRGG